ncbi:MAG TPA: protein translocase subunit SecF [Candidatus Absconditabacterales bacterium]|nr:protein translocase subunit SecF [Candidatus Absconditabacterales bacterium]HOQ79001.1 protein translocase subunit SecF [Candidatus Absconditabacterales bacterium]HPK28157.1 protein translocase subunit SecF [Candidatus Absconditabacterales bacterium]
MKARFNIIKKAPIWIAISIILFLASIFFFFSNARYSEEFTGGISLGIDKILDNQKEQESLKQYLLGHQYKDLRVSLETIENTTTFKINTKVDTDEKVAELSDEIKQYLLENNLISSTDEIIEQTITGPSVGSYMQKSAITALIVGVIFIVIYMLFSFSAIRNYVSPSILGLVVAITMIFDVAIPAGAYGVWMWLNNTIQIDSIFIIAILTIMGYGINDTIIIFDRVRENLQNKGTGKDVIYGRVFEDSIWQTMKRSVGTSFSTLLIVIAMFVFGTGIMKHFAFTIGVGIISATFASIFIATSLVYILLGKYKKEKGKF